MDAASSGASDWSDEPFYYPAVIENTSGSLVTVVFDVSLEQILGARARSTHAELSASQPPAGSHRCHQHTYDIAREEDKYAVIDDAVADSSRLERDVCVLYRSQGIARAG